MIRISHRGNVDGPKPHLENHPKYVDEAIELGFDVEVDLWVTSVGPHLGHDGPEYPVTKDWFKERITKLWVHCKNADALGFAENNGLHYFFHSTDEYTLTSYGFVWPYPGSKIVTRRCILVLPERLETSNFIYDALGEFSGVCSDYINSIGS